MLSAKHIAFLDFGSFPGIIMFTVGFNYSEVINISKRKYKDWLPALESIKGVFEEKENWGFASVRNLDGTFYYFICLKKVFDFSDQSHLRLAHEVLHSISQNLPDLLDPIIENESFCYTHSHILRQCYKILRS